MTQQYFAFQWHITEECDQRCKHCYIFAEEPDKVCYSMPWLLMTKVIENIEDSAVRTTESRIFMSRAVILFFIQISGN